MQSNKHKFSLDGFTLIELLVVISIMGILLALSTFGMQNARQSSRDGKRKADMEQIRSGLEMYRADCGTYPATSELTFGGSLTGDCPTSNTYINFVPQDPTPATAKYSYTSDGVTYTLCSTLEQRPSSYDNTGCGSCAVTTATCYYKAINP
jgi:prepilin-type N-terminal cleavage/methylation domain-containing protein